MRALKLFNLENIRASNLAIGNYIKSAPLLSNVINGQPLTLLKASAIRQNFTIDHFGRGGQAKFDILTLPWKTWGGHDISKLQFIESRNQNSKISLKYMYVILFVFSYGIFQIPLKINIESGRRISL